MLKQRAKIVAWAVSLADFLSVAVAFWAALFIREAYFVDQVGPLLRSSQYLALFAFAVSSWIGLLYAFGLYASQRTHTFGAEARRIAAVAACGTLVLMAGVFAAKAGFVSRIVVILFGGATVPILIVERGFLRLLAHAARRRGYNFRNIVVVGTGGRAREIAGRITQNPQWGMRITGYVSDHPDLRMTEINGAPVLGNTEALPHLLQTEVIDELIFAVSRKKLEAMEDLFLLCEAQGIRTRVAVNFFPHMIAKVHLEEWQGIPMLTFTTTPSNEIRLAAKRVFDVGVAALVLVGLAPVWGVIALALWATSGRPILFRQTRVGLNGRLFTLYKFRSMHRSAEEMQSSMAHLNEMAGPAFKVTNDPRATPIGRLLRKTSLDEIPQMFNVLRGDMSIVGPRPPLSAEVAQYERWQRRRLSMKPGLTCLWQIHGRNTITDFKKWMELDLRYIDTWSLQLDLKICARTLFIVLLGRGAS